jgi:NhaA family Na+:H+ antiporter
VSHPGGTAGRVVERLLAPLRDFIHAEVSGGIVLLGATVFALAWANSPWAETYPAVWQTQLEIGTEGFGLTKPLQLWINDGLMAVFFFVVGLEIKREIVAGELSSPRRALVPIAAALGGAAVPALIYLGFTFGTESARGWGIAMATDIAFALGLLALLGSRVPLTLRLFVTALAIVDDIMAVLVIAVFYTAEVSTGWLAASAALTGLLIAINRLGIRTIGVYVVIGLLLWVAVLQSGLHATLAGVLLAAAIPASTRRSPREVPGRTESALRRLTDAIGSDPMTREATHEREAALWELEAVAASAQSPLHRLEHALHPWTAFLIVPLFALANAGVAIGTYLGEAATSPISHGIVAGLVIGKQAGIVGATWIIVATGLGRLPDGLDWRHIWGAGWVCGIGFTMSLFIAELAFPGGDSLAVAKLGILAASLLAAGGGLFVLMRRGSAPAAEG